MSDEVKQAADRLRSMVNREVALFSVEEDGDKRSLGSRGVGITWNIWRDIKLIVLQYLSEHANDAENATLLTAEILQASGWYFSKFLAGYTHIDIEFALHGPYDVFAAAWHAYAIEREFGTIETVGDLRNLLEALHIDVAVVVPKDSE